MDERNRREKQSEENGKGSVYDIIVYAMMILAVIFIIVQTFTGHFTGLGFRVSLGAWILIAVGISDFIGPMQCGELDGYEQWQLYRYVFACILDALAYMCVYIFIIFIGEYKDWVHYLYLGGAVLLFAIRAVVNRSIAKSADTASSPGTPRAVRMTTLDPSGENGEAFDEDSEGDYGESNAGDTEVRLTYEEMLAEEDISEADDMGTFRSRERENEE